MRPVAPRCQDDTRSYAAPRRGTTFAELMTVLALIGIVAAIAAPRLNVARYRADAAVRVVRMTLQQAQRAAIVRQSDVIVSVDLPNRRLRVLEDNNNNGMRDGTERTTWHPLEDAATFQTPPAGVNGRVEAPVVGANVREVDGYPSVTFRRDGAASSDFELYLTVRPTVPADFRAVVITQSTGRADWFRYSVPAWAAGGL